jgi:pimeloyl-ACP methyl ester carboxylesterase
MAAVIEGTKLDFKVKSGRMGALRWGSPAAPLVIGIPGLFSDERAFEFLGSRLGSESRQVVALSLRGRERSDATATGSYGWPAHARDVLEIANLFGQEQFDVIGWSFGTGVGGQLAAGAPGRIRRFVSIDALGIPDPSHMAAAAAGAERFGVVFSSPDDYVQRAFAGSGAAMLECDQAWRTYLNGNLRQTNGGFISLTNKAAVLEDAQYMMKQDPDAFLPALTMPVLIVRAMRPLLPGIGLAVTREACDRLTKIAPNARIVEVDANHLCVVMAEATVEAIASFLDRPHLEADA